jgi:hypothetical protein
MAANSKTAASPHLIPNKRGLRKSRVSVIEAA